LEVCCCADIRAEAIRREQAADTALTGGVFMPDKSEAKEIKTA